MWVIGCSISGNRWKSREVAGAAECAPVTAAIPTKVEARTLLHTYSFISTPATTISKQHLETSAWIIHKPYHSPIKQDRYHCLALMLHNKIANRPVKKYNGEYFMLCTRSLTLNAFRLQNNRVYASHAFFKYFFFSFRRFLSWLSATCFIDGQFIDIGGSFRLWVSGHLCEP